MGIVQRALHAVGKVDRALELACGTGIWTGELLKVAGHVTALDASPEVIAINRVKLNAANVDYRQQELFNWQPDAEYDLVAFCFWLSHVPPEKLDEFLLKVSRAVRSGGKLFFVDSLPAESGTAKDQQISDSGLTTRRLNDGQTFQIVKVFYDPARLEGKLASIGFDVEVGTTGSYFVYGVGTKR